MRTALLTPLILTCLTVTAAAQKPAKISNWDAFPGGLRVKSRDGEFRTTLDRKQLALMVRRIGELRRIYDRFPDRHAR